MINKFGQYYKRKPIKPALRLAVYERDNFTCQYCGLHADEGELQIDHIIPVSRGGTNNINNLVTSCSACNKKKGAKLMKMGEKIRALRKGKYTQEELAERLGMHINTIVRWERGDRMPTADKLKALADVLGTTPSELLSSDDPQPSAQNESALSMSPQTYTQEQLNKGMLVYTLSNGERIELPPIQVSYDFLRDIAIHSARNAVV